MNTLLLDEIENQLATDSATEVNAINQGFSRMRSAYKKNNRTPWDTSVLQGIKLQHALSSLRCKDKELLALQSQLFDNNLNG